MNELLIIQWVDYDCLNNRGSNGRIVIDMENFFPCNETKFRKVMKWIEHDNIHNYSEQIETMMLFFERKKEESVSKSKSKAWYTRHYETLEQISRS